MKSRRPSIEKQREKMTMNEVDNDASASFDDAWLLLGQHGTSLANGSNCDSTVFVKMSSCMFRLGPDNKSIGNMYVTGREYAKTAFDIVYDPLTKEEVVHDIYDLHCSTPLELFVELQLRGAVFSPSRVANGENACLVALAEAKALREENSRLKEQLKSIGESMRQLSSQLV